MIKFVTLKGDERGATALEFALIAPVLFAFIIGIVQVGIFLFANAGLKNAVGQAARIATLFPTPTNAEIVSRFDATKFGLSEGVLSAPVIARNTVDGRDYVDITLTYTYTINPVFFPSQQVALSESEADVHPVEVSLGRRALFTETH